MNCGKSLYRKWRLDWVCVAGYVFWVEIVAGYKFQVVSVAGYRLPAIRFAKVLCF